jgi:hypothetical protein
MDEEARQYFGHPQADRFFLLVDYCKINLNDFVPRKFQIHGYKSLDSRTKIQSLLELFGMTGVQLYNAALKVRKRPVGLSELGFLVDTNLNVQFEDSNLVAIEGLVESQGIESLLQSLPRLEAVEFVPRANSCFSRACAMPCFVKLEKLAKLSDPFPRFCEFSFQNPEVIAQIRQLKIACYSALVRQDETEVTRIVEQATKELEEFFSLIRKEAAKKLIFPCDLETRIDRRCNKFGWKGNVLCTHLPDDAIQRLLESTRIEKMWYRKCLEMNNGEKVLFFYYGGYNELDQERYQNQQLDQLPETIVRGHVELPPVSICAAFDEYFPPADDSGETNGDYVLRLLANARELVRKIELR